MVMLLIKIEIFYLSKKIIFNNNFLLKMQNLNLVFNLTIKNGYTKELKSILYLNNEYYNSSDIWSYYIKDKSNYLIKIFNSNNINRLKYVLSLNPKLPISVYIPNYYTNYPLLKFFFTFKKFDMMDLIIDYDSNNILDYNCNIYDYNKSNLLSHMIMLNNPLFKNTILKIIKKLFFINHCIPDHQAFFNAIDNNDLELIQLLVEKNIDLHEKNFNKNPLMHAIINNKNNSNQHIIDYLMELYFDQKIDLNFKYRLSFLKNHDYTYNSNISNEYFDCLFFVACQYGNINIIKKLDNNNIVIKTRDYFGDNALKYAALNKNTDQSIKIINFLINYLNINHRNKENKTCIYYCLDNEIKFFELIKLGAKINVNMKSKNNSILAQSIELKNNTIIKYVIENTKLKNHFVPIFIQLCKHANLDNIKLFINKYKSNLNYSLGIITAIETDNLELFNYLIELTSIHELELHDYLHKLLTSIKDSIVSDNKIKIFDFLINNDLLKSIINETIYDEEDYYYEQFNDNFYPSKTLLDFAFEFGSKEIISKLIDKGSKLTNYSLMYLIKNKLNQLDTIDVLNKYFNNYDFNKCIPENISFNYTNVIYYRDDDRHNRGYLKTYEDEHMVQYTINMHPIILCYMYNKKYMIDIIKSYNGKLTEENFNSIKKDLLKTNYTNYNNKNDLESQLKHYYSSIKKAKIYI